MTLSIIVAVAENNAIGKDNELLWHLPADFKWFKENTLGKPVVMGKKTWESLPRRPLPGRRNIVISDDPNDRFEGAEMAYNLTDPLKMTAEEEEIFIIGGGSIYRQYFEKADRLYITHVHKAFEADTFFPEIEPSSWKEVFRQNHEADQKNPYPYSFVIYERT